FVALVKLLWREIAKCGVVGGIGCLIDTGIFLWLITCPMQEAAVKSKIIATAVAVICSWVANRYWTFRNRLQSDEILVIVLFLMINGFGFGIQSVSGFISNYGLGVL